MVAGKKHEAEVVRRDPALVLVALVRAFDDTIRQTYKNLHLCLLHFSRGHLATPENKK